MHPEENFALEQGLSDENLIRQYLDGATLVDRDRAFEELFRRYRDRVARWCVKFTRDTESGHDLAQDVFLRTINGLRGFRGGSRFSTWIYVVARNHCRNVVERRSGEPIYVDPDHASEVPDPHWMKAYSVIEAAAACRAECRDILAALTRLEAEVVMLHYGNDLSLAEVGQALGLTNKSGAKAYIVSARRKLTGLVDGRRRSNAGALACTIR